VGSGRHVSGKLRTGNYAGDTPDVLVIDDDEDVRWAIVELLQLLGFVAIGAMNGVEGLRLAAERSPKVILLDLRMPVMNGWQFLDQRRQIAALASIPLAVVTAEPVAVPLGVDVQALVRKPIGEEELRALVDRLMVAPGVAAARSS
jgi:CheY-like chemotaxis protein